MKVFFDFDGPNHYKNRAVASAACILYYASEKKLKLELLAGAGAEVTSRYKILQNFRLFPTPENEISRSIFCRKSLMERPLAITCPIARKNKNSSAPIRMSTRKLKFHVA